MLTLDELKGNDTLKGLSEDQLKAVLKLNEISENKAIGDKTRTIWDSVDADIEAVTGLKKPTTAKSYEHLKTVLSKAGGEDTTKLQGEIATLKTQLSDAVKNGKGDEGLKSQLAAHEAELDRRSARITKLQGDITTVTKDYEGKLSKREEDLVGMKYDNTFNEYTRGLQFKANIPKEAIDALVTSARNRVKATGKPEFKQVGDKTNIYFKDEGGLQMYDEKNGHQPITAEGLFLKELAPILAEGTPTGGTGSGGAGAGKGTINLNGATTRREALELVTKAVANEGLIEGTVAFAEREFELATENKATLDTIK